jgi:hypothetical protein
VRSRKAKAEIPNPKFQSTKDGFIVFGIWSLELGISMFFSSKRSVESPAIIRKSKSTLFFLAIFLQIINKFFIKF